MILLALSVFSFCCWAIFSKHFHDGILAKHFLAFSGITSFLVILDPWNLLAAYTSIGLLAIGLVLWYYRGYRPVMTARAIQKERLTHR